MSAFGPKRTCASALHMSAFDPKRTWPPLKWVLQNCSVGCAVLVCLFIAQSHTKPQPYGWGFCLSVLRTCTYIWCSFRAEPVMPPGEQQSAFRTSFELLDSEIAKTTWE